MLKNKVAWPLALLVCASLWACGSDDDSTGGPPGGAGEGGASAAGHGGKSSGGSGGQATSGGGGGQAGSATGGTSGAAPEAGSGGDFPSVSGMPGMTEGGAGEAGSGGQGSASSTTLAQDCATVCGAQTGLTCSYGDTCVLSCLGVVDPQAGTAVPDEYTAMIKCQAATLTAANYGCSTQMSNMVQPSPKAGTGCETLICKYTCDDGTLVDDNIVARCGC
ncbi:MAG: hypothetical protein ABI548_19045 [Polyangiaceae bacterium]